MFRFGDVVIDQATREVRVAGELRHLEPQAFDVLWLLASHRERVVPKAELLEKVWGTQFVSESALTTRIKEARRAVGDDGRAQRVIKNVRGAGYRFVAELRLQPSEPSAQAPGPGGSSSLRLKPKLVERRPSQKFAYASLGAGPSLIFMPGWISSLDAYADGSDPRTGLITRLARDFTVTLFDRYGTGLSASDEPDPSLEGSVAEVTTLLELVGSKPTTLFASSAAGPAAVLAAANNPRVHYLVFLCTYASGPAVFTNTQAKANLCELVRSSWGMGSRILADMIAPGIDAVTRAAFARFQQRTAKPEVAAGYLEQLYEADASAALPALEQPSLILHYRDDPAIPFAGGSQLAKGIEDTELVPMDGPYHTPPSEHLDSIASAVRRFVQGEGR